MTVTVMPHDVATCWNSTFDMVKYALEHRQAINLITQGRNLGLWKFELRDHKWKIVEQVHNVLKVINNCLNV